MDTRIVSHHNIARAQMRHQLVLHKTPNSKLHRRQYGCTPETLHTWVRRAEQDQGRRAGVTSDASELIMQKARERSASGKLGATPSDDYFSFVNKAVLWHLHPSCHQILYFNTLLNTLPAVARSTNLHVEGQIGGTLMLIPTFKPMLAFDQPHVTHHDEIR